MNAHPMTFRGRDFIVQEGAVHPAYSLACFREDGEEHDFRERFWSPKPGDIVVDAGASYGAYAITAAVMGATVLAFEPEPTVFVDLERNCKLNPLLDVRAYDVGLWDRAEAGVDMYSYGPHWPAGTVTAPFRMVTLDSFGLSRVDLMKIDTEGCERRVLAGAEDTIRRCRPTLIVEVHTFLDAALLVECKKAIQAHGGYAVEEIPRDPCVLIVCTPEERR